MRRRVRHRGAHVVAYLMFAVVAPRPGLAGQSKDQQACVNDMNKFGERVAKSQDGASLDCIKNAGRGIVFRLGIPPQAQTAQACLTNDVGGKVAKATTQLEERDASRCLAAPEQLPVFGYSAASSTDAAARAASLGIVAGLFGPDLDASIVSDIADPVGARCQSDVTRYTTDLFEDIWKEALKTKKNVLNGSGRLTGSDPDAPVGSAAELGAELVAAIQGDARGKIAKAALKLHDRTVQRCTGTTAPIAQMFRGSCGTAATPEDLAHCAEGKARGAFYQSLAGFDALTFDCDLTDNGATDLSCESAALREHVLDRIGYG